MLRVDVISGASFISFHLRGREEGWKIGVWFWLPCARVEDEGEMVGNPATLEGTLRYQPCSTPGPQSLTSRRGLKLRVTLFQSARLDRFFAIQLLFHEPSLTINIKFKKWLCDAVLSGRVFAFVPSLFFSMGYFLLAVVCETFVSENLTRNATSPHVCGSVCAHDG